MDLKDLQCGADGLIAAAVIEAFGDLLLHGRPGEAAASCYNMLDVYAFCLPNAFWLTGPTYSGAAGQATRPDYLV
eukprot:7543606-Pyramimonas_sp.AAC.1